jgi:uncharacterized protein (DUF983 family)
VNLDLLMPQVFAGIVLVAGVALFVGYRTYQRCPHCGRIARRVVRGWRRCPSCGRQYRRGLRLR